jgi:hypothetical protein
MHSPHAICSSRGRAIAMRIVSAGTVIPGLPKGEPWCTIAHLRISKFRVRCFASPRNDGARKTWMAGTPRPAMTLRRRQCETPRMAYAIALPKMRVQDMPPRSRRALRASLADSLPSKER